MTGQLAGLLWFRRFAGIPFAACRAALESWQLNGHGGEPRAGNSVLRGPIQRDHHFGARRIEAGLARAPVRMRLGTEPWSPAATALELIPCQRVRPSAACFAVGHRLLDSLTGTLPARVPAQQRPDRTSRRGYPASLAGPLAQDHERSGLAVVTGLPSGGGQPAQRVSDRAWARL